MTAPVPTVKCPHCGTAVEWKPENTYRPFCSKRCKLIDLGQWADESYTVAAEDEPMSGFDGNFPPPRH